ncbi:protein of unknown function [Parafilimonas terrae]|uniref:DUF4412 domain-containing protein n=2 Tax=Parafilimonas terrae TaxID=1465490 RepID=A0A1I5RFH1_9BACT|nr:protein of unknown function [Parafilimonas terrae]
MLKNNAMKNTTSVCYYAKHIANLFLLMCLLLCVNVQAQDSKDYKFRLGITYTTTSGDKAHDIKMWLSDEAYTGIEASENSGSAFIIFNMKDKKMITIMETQKMAMIMDLGKYQQMMTQKMKEAEDSLPKVEKTGITEKILGYNCDQYKITSDKSQTLVWITKELGNGFAGFSKSLMMMLNNGRSKPQGASIPDIQAAADGVMMKMEATDLSSNKVTKMEATAINKDGKDLNISDYKTMSM